MAEFRIKTGDLVTTRFDQDIMLTQNAYTSKLKRTTMRKGEVALVTWVGTRNTWDACVLFLGEAWNTPISKLRVMNDG